VDVPYVLSNECNTGSYADIISDGVLCAGYPLPPGRGQGAFQDASGGPMSMDVNGVITITGNMQLVN
jgi:hypothetical protein